MFTEIISTLDHSIEHSSNALPSLIQFVIQIRFNVTTLTGVIKPGLGFHCFAKGFVDLDSQMQLDTCVSPNPQQPSH
jgi:hypothetical protein